MMRRLFERLRSWLGSPRAPLWIVFASILATLPTLPNGLSSDDYWHRITLTRDPSYAPVLMKPWHQLFVFYDGNASRSQYLIDAGLAPWWADPAIVVSFFRPLSSATHALDYVLWPSHPWLMHAQSIAWYAALVALTAWLYGRILGGGPRSWIAGLAALLFALDFNHGITVGWIANRNAVIAAVFAVAAVGTHDVAARGDGGREGGKPWSVLSAALLALALAAGESGIGAVGYLAAHAMFFDTRAWRSKVQSLALHLLVVIGWAVLYRAFGYGVRGSGMYVEALRDPLHFVGDVLVHLPIQIACELGAPSPDLYMFVPVPLKIAIFAAALVFVTWAAPAFVRLLRADASARFFAAGGVLATIPPCMTFPASRTMTLPSVGLVAIAALIGAGVFESAAWVPSAGARWHRWIRIYALWACGARLFLSPVALEINLQQLVLLNRIVARMGTDLPVSPEAEQRRVILMNAPDTVFAPYLVLGRRAAGEKVPARILTMAGGARDVELSRIDERTVRVRAEGGFYRTGTEVVTRRVDSPMPIGTKLSLSEIDIEVTATTPDGVANEASFRFAGSADADAFVWARWEGPKLVITHPPKIGDHLTIPGQFPQIF